MPTASAFLAKAASQIGYREPYVNGSYNNDTPYGRWYGLNFQPYCAMGMSWCANEIGALGTIVPKYASCTAGLHWFRSRGQTGVWPPRKGDIFILLEYAPNRWNAEANGWAPIHTGAVEAWEGDLNSGYIVTVEFNTNDGGSSQGNGVYRLRRWDSKDSNHLIYCRPKWDPEPAPPSRTDTRPPLTTQPTIKVANVRPGARNEDVRRFNKLMWDWVGPTFRARWHARWMSESANHFGPISQQVLQAVYAALAKREPKNFSPVTLPTWPGREVVIRMGGKPS